MEHIKPVLDYTIEKFKHINSKASGIFPLLALNHIDLDKIDFIIPVANFFQSSSEFLKRALPVSAIQQPVVFEFFYGIRKKD